MVRNGKTLHTTVKVLSSKFTLLKLKLNEHNHFIVVDIEARTNIINDTAQ